MAVIHVTKDNFEDEVMKSDKPILIDFWAVWCGPCQMLTPVIEELGNEVTTAKICKINVDEQPELARQYNVMSIPTVLVIKNGEVIKTSVGAVPKAKLLKLLEEV